jgi:hypothetical protein
MKTPKKERPTLSEADDYRRRARQAETAAEMAETAEAKHFYLEIAKQWYETADRAEEPGR